MSDEMTTERHNGPGLIKERSTNKKTPDYVTRASQPREGVGVDMSTCPPPTSDVHPSEDGPEPVGAIAERVLTDLAHGRDPHLAARQAEALNRLTRAHHKEQHP